MDSIFNNNEKLKVLNADLSKWNVSNVADMEKMFINAKNFNVDLSKWDISNITAMLNEDEDEYKNKVFNYDRNFLDKSRQLKYLAGPTNFVYFHDINGRRILLLGEEHYNEPECPNGVKYQRVSQWLYDLSINNKICLDIFLEIENTETIFGDAITSLFLNLNYGAISEIYNMFKNFKSIFYNNNVRLHKIDTRHRGNYFDAFRRISIHSINHVSYEEPIGKSIELFEYSSGLNENYVGKTQFRKYQKNIFKIYEGHNYKKSDFENYMQDYENYRIKYIKSINKKINKIIDFNTTVFLECLYRAYYTTFKYHEKIEHNFFMLFNINMDVYFLLRFLNTYDKLERGPKNCRLSKFSTAQNSIVYAGYNHTTVYKNFIEYYFHVTPTINIESNSHCIKLVEKFDFFKGL